MATQSAVKNETMTTIRERGMAIELIKRDMRLGFVKYLLSKVEKTEVSRLWKEIHPNKKTRSGCLPSSCSGRMKTPFERVYGASLLVCYLKQMASICKPMECIIDPATLCSAWDMVDARMKKVRPESCDINLMYLIVHDYVSGQVELVECPKCHCKHLKHTNWAAKSGFQQCPHCEMKTQSAA